MGTAAATAFSPYIAHTLENANTAIYVGRLIYLDAAVYSGSLCTLTFAIFVVYRSPTILLLLLHKRVFYILNTLTMAGKKSATISALGRNLVCIPFYLHRPLFSSYAYSHTHTDLLTFYFTRSTNCP